MAKYTVEVSTIMCSAIGLVDTFQKMDQTKQKHYLKISESLNPNPVQLIEAFGVKIFDYYFPNLGETSLMTKTAIWKTYRDDFKKQFWYEFWSKEIGQENPEAWQVLTMGRMRKSLPMLMIEIEQLLTKDQSFITEVSEAQQKQAVNSDSQDKNNNVSFGNNNSLSASATTPQDQLNFAIAVKSSYNVENQSDIVPDVDVKSKSIIEDAQPVESYNFDYADHVDGNNANSNETNAGFNHNVSTNEAQTDNTSQGRSKDIFELIGEMDQLVDGVFIAYFDKMKSDSLFIGIN